MMIKRIILSVVCMLVALLSLTNAQANLTPKNLAGLPSDFESFNLPNPKDVAQSSNSALLPVQLTTSKDSDDLVWTTTLPVDTDDEFTITLLSNFTTMFDIVAIPPANATMFAPQYYHQRRHSSRRHINEPSNVVNGEFGIDGNVIPSTSYIWENPVQGMWTIQVTAPSTLLKVKSFRRLFDSNTPAAFILAYNPSEYQITTYLSSYNNLFVGQPVPVLAMLTSSEETLPRGQRPAGYLPKPLRATNVVATMTITTPNGQSTTISMADDGLHQDGEANDGLYGAFVTPNEVGNYQTSVSLQGVGPDGVALLRTAQHIIPVTSEFLTLTGKTLASQTNESVNLYFEVESSSSDLPSVRLYSEVWGTNSTGDNVPVAWVGGITSLTKYNNLNVLTAVLDNRWIAQANVTAPFTVRNLIVNELDTFIPVYNTTDSFAVKMTHKYRDVRRMKFDPPLNVITKQQREGKMPSYIAERYGKVKNVKEGNGKLILVHGYCASGNPFTFSDFTNAVQFEDLGQNRNTDDFAKLVAAFGQDFTDGYSLIGHSQGGLVGLHLATYYHSYLDLSAALPGTLLQSVGSPYQGTGLAGTLASIGSAIGIGCSANDDLTHDGAALWLNSIPTSTRQLVSFTTTQYKTGSIINYCNLGANSVLKWPNDGVTDQYYSILPSGNYANHIKGWCHTTDMKSPPQCQNSDNNKEMNEKSVW